MSCLGTTPTYYAKDITVTLGFCDLEASLSNTHIKQGSELRTETNKLQALYSKAEKLPECPLGGDGSEKSVLQFIGPSADIPFCMVEAGEAGLATTNPRADSVILDMLGNALPAVSSAFRI